MVLSLVETIASGSEKDCCAPFELHRTPCNRRPASLASTFGGRVSVGGQESRSSLEWSCKRVREPVNFDGWSNGRRAKTMRNRAEEKETGGVRAKTQTSLREIAGGEESNSPTRSGIVKPP